MESTSCLASAACAVAFDSAMAALRATSIPGVGFVAPYAKALAANKVTKAKATKEPKTSAKKGKTEDADKEAGGAIGGAADPFGVLNKKDAKKPEGKKPAAKPEMSKEE